MEGFNETEMQPKELKLISNIINHAPPFAGSPLQSPPSATGKLATVLLGSLGIPLLLFSVFHSGKQLAATTLNSLLIVRHYCFSLPIHYLCCSCNLILCLRVLSWCCCCCCCFSYLCLAGKRRKRKFCDKRRAPKLCLRKRPPGGATRTVMKRPTPTAHVIAADDQTDG